MTSTEPSGEGVREAEDPRIGRILTLIDEAARPRPAEEVLGVLCAEVATIIDAPVASIYVRDEGQEETLVMRANIGFPGGAVGRVRLPVGEGITGFAAECMRPATLTTANDDEHFVPVPGLGEEEFPVFLALPILVGHRAEAVLVLQRRAGRTFSRDEIVLATALATSFAYALERARAREELEEDRAARKVHLRARVCSGASALARVETLPTFSGLQTLAHTRGADRAPASDEEAARRLLDPLDQLERQLRRAAEPLRSSLERDERAALDSLMLLFVDQRLRSLCESESIATPNPALAFERVARACTRAPYDVGVDRADLGRADELELACLIAAARSIDLRVPNQGSALLLTDRLPAVAVLLCLAQRASAIAVARTVPQDSLAIALARSARLAVVDQVGSLFAWARVGDRVLIDVDEGAVEIHPSEATVARFRSGR